MLHPWHAEQEKTGICPGFFSVQHAVFSNQKKSKGFLLTADKDRQQLIYHRYVVY
jgi:hypothetical protein